ncbi:hypothetical protein QYE76_027843 [Lolium multiflorum]|uniref:Transposase (putative) gypsy type domain-containing protein n=1 Tax=Lolium multiflorum TaxID=4521 RepID=A0AAD8QJU9_LOLMU|nr:hypothetical protein QYE76_027843 [Lolium multiflorum]
MREDDIERLVRLRRIPAEVITRAPGVEMDPRPNPGERVVFGAHFDRGLGLPASHFFRRFLDFFGLQPHHLPANACVLLSCYVAFIEGYAGLWPDVEFGAGCLHQARGQRPPAGLRRAPRSTPARARPSPRIPTVDSVKGGRLSAEDLLCTYAERWVLPLRMRVHKIGHMSGRLDPTWMSKVELTKAQVARRVNNITKANMPENWDWGLPPYNRASPPELLFDRQGIEDGDLAQKVWTPDHVDPADQAGDQAGDDELPEVSDKGGQGEHNLPPSPEHQEEQEEPAMSGTGPIPAVPLRVRPPAASATSAPKGKKRAIGGSTAAVEARAPIKFTQGGGSGYPHPPPPAAEGADDASTRARRHPSLSCRCGYAASRGIFFGCTSSPVLGARPG